MSAVDDLAAIQNGATLHGHDAREQLEALLDLSSVGVSVLGARLFGQGSRASVEIPLSNGDTMTWETVRDMARPANLAAEVAVCAQATPKLTQAQALRAVALVRGLADRERTMTDNDIAVDWGVSYLQAAIVLDVDLSDQTQRWAAFERLGRHEPYRQAREEGTSVANAGLVLRAGDGSRLVRAGWYYQHVRTLDAGMSQNRLANRMAQVGWTRRAGSGRIKATAPGRQATLGWNFWTVPAGWEDDQ